MAKEKCDDCSGFRENIRELCEFKRNMSGPEGTLQRLFDSMETKVGRGLLVTVVLILFSLVGTLYGLNYKTQGKILDQMVEVKTSIAVMAEKLKTHSNDAWNRKPPPWERNK